MFSLTKKIDVSLKPLFKDNVKVQGVGRKRVSWKKQPSGKYRMVRHNLSQYSFTHGGRFIYFFLGREFNKIPSVILLFEFFRFRWISE